MWSGTGPREVRINQAFDEPFVEPPSVMVGLSMWDIDHRKNSRVDLLTENVTATGFDFVFRTWSDTRVARIRAEWTAFGLVPDEDAWNLV